MSINDNNIPKVLDGLKKKIDHIDKKQDTIIKECKDIFKKLDAKITMILSIIEEFEIMMGEDVSENDGDIEEDNLYREWTPYDEAYESEDYENYGDDEENFD